MTDSQDFSVHITAEQAWPAFEEAVLNARSEVVAGFRIFDFATPLHSDAARAVGEDWGDLVEHVVRRGVSFRLVLSDFDPVMATELHETTWRSMRQAAAIAELLGPDAQRFRVVPALHPTRAGTVPRLAFLPKVLQRLNDRLASRGEEDLEREAVGLKTDEVPDLYPVSHHQKLAVIDREVLYIGGLDLNPRRYDTRDHMRPAARTWSDLQVLLRGPEAAAAGRHLDTFLRVIDGREAPLPCGAIRRTVSQPRRFGFWALSPRTVLREIEEDHLQAFEAAQHMIYLETQFFRSSVIADALVAAAHRNPDLSLIVVLPALPEDVAFDHNRGVDARYGMALQARAVERVQEAFGTRACFATPVQKRLAARDGPGVLAGSPVIHVHNKLTVVDDDFALVSSANLNGRSMRWDTEAALRITDPARVDVIWQAVTDHWWDGDVPAGARDLERGIGVWCDGIRKNTVRLPEHRRGFLVSHDPQNHAELHQMLPGVTENIV